MHRASLNNTLRKRSASLTLPEQSQRIPVEKISHKLVFRSFTDFAKARRASLSDACLEFAQQFSHLAACHAVFPHKPEDAHLVADGMSGLASEDQQVFNMLGR